MILNLLVTLLLLVDNPNLNQEKTYVVLIDFIYWEHGKDEDGAQYHYQNWAKSSGFIYKDQDGVWVLSNAHIIPHGTDHLVEGSIFVSFHPDLQHDPEEIEFRGHDPKIDVSLFRFINQESAKNLPHAIMGVSENLKVGQRVVAIGNPWPIKFAETIGHINSVDFIGFSINENQPHLLVHSCMINPGSSGGPLINLFNEVVGINRMTFLRPNIFNLAVPSDDIKFLLPKLKRGGEVEHQTVGLIGFANTWTLSDLDLSKLNIDTRPQKGIMVFGFKPNSTVDLAGFQKGDIVISCNGQEPRNLINFLKMIYLKAEPYEILKIEVDRYGQKLTLPLLLVNPDEKEIKID
ncbi:MAG: trypsin-like peptidase domain-containing protein [Patescibacteria group bacterium]